MKKVFEYWLPDTDVHFEKMISKRVSKGGPAEYQDDTRDEVYKFVKDFDTVVDVGANVGFWSKPLTKKFKRVIAFEPMQQVYECLELNTQGLNVDIHKFALGEQNSTVNIIYNEENTGASTVDTSSYDNGNIKIKTLDSLNLPKFGLLKVDCERFDLHVLKGAEQTILKYKPIIVVEQHPDTDYEAGAYLKSLGAKVLSNVRKDYIFGW